MDRNKDTETDTITERDIQSYERNTNRCILNKSYQSKEHRDRRTQPINQSINQTTNENTAPYVVNEAKPDKAQTDD